MLALRRRAGESIRIGHDITVMITDVSPHAAKLGVDAPLELMINREEVYRRLYPHGAETLERDEKLTAAAICKLVDAFASRRDLSEHERDGGLAAIAERAVQMLSYSA